MINRLMALLAALVLGFGAATVYAQGEVNVYSYRQPFLIKPMFDAFTRETGIQVNVVFARDGLIERLTQEGRNSPADLIFTVDIGRLNDAVEAGVTQAVENETLDANIPAQYRDPDGHWFGLTTRARIIAASRERVPEGAIDSYEDLAESEWEGRVCTRSGKHVYNVALIASMIAHHGQEQAEQWLASVKNNLARKPQGGDRDQVKAVSEGECDIALLNSYYMGAMLADEEQSQWANAVRIVFPNQNDRGTHVNISGMALTTSAPNRDNAIRLMEFLSGALAQQMYAEQNNEYPVNPNAPWSGLLKSWGGFEADELPLATVAANRGEAIKMVDRVGYDQ
jgi:iron(III) transport system substrate-binding protein